MTHRNRRRTVARRLLATALVLCLLAAGGLKAHAQSTPSTQSAARAPEDDAAQASRRRRRASKPAEVSSNQVLQLEYGYSGDFWSDTLRAAQAATLTINYSATPDLLVEFSHDNVAVQTPRGASSAGGIGNAYLGVQYTVSNEDERRPSLGLAYQLTAPTGSRAAGISSGGY